MTFRSHVFSADRPRFEKLAAGQNPMVNLLTCSDSPIDSYALIVASAEDLFVIRNAGML